MENDLFQIMKTDTDINKMHLSNIKPHGCHLGSQGQSQKWGYLKVFDSRNVHAKYEHYTLYSSKVTNKILVCGQTYNNVAPLTALGLTNNNTAENESDRYFKSRYILRLNSKDFSFFVC